MYTIEEYDVNKTKVLQYVLYKKRTQQEVWRKFYGKIEESMLEDIVAELKENGYISDQQYVERAIKEFMALRAMSIKEIQYKLMSKGVDKTAIEEYMAEHWEELQDYEIASATKMIQKQMDKEEIQVIAYLARKGYTEDSIRKAIEEI